MSNLADYLRGFGRSLKKVLLEYHLGYETYEESIQNMNYINRNFSGNSADQLFKIWGAAYASSVFTRPAATSFELTSIAAYALIKLVDPAYAENIQFPLRQVEIMEFLKLVAFPAFELCKYLLRRETKSLESKS